ncbi:MAG: OmpA family protein [Prolixibacteraceae bacterium]|nr:OmpA family protein [Prolixibacteraceae bacterium]
MEKSELNHLRQLLFNLDEDELNRIKRLLNYPNDLALAISKVLPEAVLFSIHDGERLTSALVPMIETVITRSVAKNPRLLADALYPVIGRSIRKSINEEFKKLLLTFNELIENTFSIQSLKWRYQAMVTGRKYSEVVISNTIKYKAEHVFLIHRESGLLLCDVHDEMNPSADPDAVSGMLKAITDFVHDSFAGTGDSELNLIEMADYQVLIEQGPHAIMAALVKGFTLDEYRELLQQTLEQIHKDYAASFQTFSGDTFIFDTSRELLSHCLKTEKKEAFAGKKSRIGLLVAIPVLAVLLFLAGRGIYHNWQWNQYIGQLQQSRLLMLSQHGKANRTYFVHGLILPGAQHPDQLLPAYHFPKTRFVSHWQLFLPGSNQIVSHYLDAQLGIPPGVRIEVRADSVFLSGTTYPAWKEKFDAYMLNNFSWFTIVNDPLTIIDDKVLMSMLTDFQQQHLYFKMGTTELTSESEQELDRLAVKLQSIVTVSESLSKKLEVSIAGYADQYGDASYNRFLSAKRAGYVIEELTERGIPGDLFNFEGKGVLESSETIPADQRRRVDFILTIASHD